MLRASAAAEAAGFPSASLVCEGFLGQAATTAAGLGMPNLPLATVPGHVDGQTSDELRANLTDVTLDAVVSNLTEEPVRARLADEPSPDEVVFAGSFEAVNQYFYERGWTDGLPVVPPTRERVEAFLSFTDREPHRELGVLLPDRRRVTPWNVAVNGVMAGCRPEYMPILIALAEAMADPGYGVEHSGNTPGAETLIVLDGPIIEQLDFNYTQGALRDGFMANTTIGRFWRLYLRNVAGFLPHATDKATYGNTWRVVLAENESALREAGWLPVSADFGFAPGENVVTIARYTGGDVLTSAFGSTAEEILPYLADGVLRQNGWQVAFTVGLANGTLRPLLVLSPMLASTLARSGWSKADVKQYLFEHVRMPAHRFERYIGEYTNLAPGRPRLFDLARAGEAAAVFGQSEDPERLVPIVARPEDFMIAVTGDPLRNNAYTFAHNGRLGFPTARRVDLPADWDQRLARLEKS